MAAVQVPDDVVAFSTINNLTTCDSLIVDWQGSGNMSEILTLAVVGVTNAVPGGGSDIVFEVIGINIPLNQSEFEWSEANVPVGMYQMQAYDLEKNSFGSNYFWINDGDTSCLGNLSTWTTPASSPSSTSASSLSSSSRISSGAIAGIVIAIVAALLAVLLLFAFARKRRRARLSALGGATRKEKRSKGWTNLDALKPHPFMQNDVGENGYPKDKKSVVNPFDDSAAVGGITENKGREDVQEITIHSPTGLPAYSSPIETDFRQEV